MFQNIFKLIFILLSIYSVFCECLDENTIFVNTAELSGANYKLDWNYTDTDIIFRATARTTGWVGFGLSPNGGMRNSDLILSWTANGVNQFRDAHTENENSVLYDTVQNWHLLFYSQGNGVTTVIFKRSIKVCNPNQPVNEINIDISPTQYVIFAWGTNYQNNLPAYHGSNRGSRFLPLLSSLEKIQLDMGRIEVPEDFRINTTIKSDQQTEYFCAMHSLPDDFTINKRHLVRYDTLIRPGHEKYVHHWVILECNIEFENVYLKNNSMPQPGTCAGTKGATAEWAEIESKYCNRGGLGMDLKTFE
jgi:hypothetical protein